MMQSKLRGLRPFQRVGAPGALPRRRVSRGQALAEFALFVPLLLFMLVGATDISALLNDHLNIIYATRSSARVGATLGTAPQADCAIIGSIQAALSNTHDVTVQQIIIYKSDNNGNPITDDEDVYPGNAVCNPDGTISPGALALNWPPSVRSTTPFTEDSIGVEVDFTYTTQYNILGLGQLGSSYDRAVTPMEVVVNS